MKTGLFQTALTVAGCLLGAAAIAQGPQAIRIGDINSYSTATGFAMPYRRGWQLAVEQINSAGGVAGRPVEVLARDDGSRPQQAALHAKQLVAEGVDVLAGTYSSDTGLAVAKVAARERKVFIAAGPMTDAIAWDKGNRYTFRLSPSTYLHAAALAQEAAALPARRWAVLAPNYEYGQSAVDSFRLLLKEMRPDVEFVVEQWPPLGAINAQAVVRALERAKPEAIFNVTSGSDLVQFVREGARRGIFRKTVVLSMLAGSEENLDLLKGDIPRGWIVTGYPLDQIRTPEYERFAQSYRRRYGEPPQLASVLGYTMVMAVAQAIGKAESTDSERLLKAMRGLQFDSPLGVLTFRAIDQQSTLGTYVGALDQAEEEGRMTGWRYINGNDYLPDEKQVKKRRPTAAIR